MTEGKDDSSQIILIEDNKERFLGRKKHICKICNKEGMFESFLAREMMQNKRDEFEYFVCDKCGCLQIGEIPSDLGDYYGEGYYSFALPEDSKREYSSPAIRHEKILDVGCGSGAWLVLLAEGGHDNLFGCDPFINSDIRQGDRIYIKKCTIHEMDGEGSYDLIHMGDSFEHVTDPLETLLSAKRLLKDGGILMMDIPTYPNIAFEMFGPHWYQLDAPRHIYLHSRKSIEYLSEQSGLKVIEYKYNSNSSQIIRSFFYKNGVPFNNITSELICKYFSKEDIKSIEENAMECNKNGYGDHMTVTFIKG